MTSQIHPTQGAAPTYLGHPPGLFLLFFVEMWERFSYYGMRGLLVLYLVSQASGNNPGRGWTTESAANLYGWYTGLAYLLPIAGGLIADKLIGAHRSLLIGGLIIAMGHIALAASGLGSLGRTAAGMSIFIAGLALIIIGTGHFKPNVSVMVGSLYPALDPRRDGAFTIFYMGINLGAFLCAFVCGTLGEKVGWHWGFGAAAVGMLVGLLTYILARPTALGRIGDPPAGVRNYAPFFLMGAIAMAAFAGAIFYFGEPEFVGRWIDNIESGFFRWLILAALIAAPIFFVWKQKPGERGPTAAILIFVVLSAVFWMAYEQAGSSLNLFAENMTNRRIGNWQMPATWFQSVNPLLIISLAPLFASLWPMLGRRNANPSQAVKLAIGLFLLGGGYVFMVIGSIGTSPLHPASMFWLLATYFLITLGELCMSPTGLAFLTRAAPVRFVSFLMGVWFLSNAMANIASGKIAGQIDRISRGEVTLFWYRWFRLGGQADFFLLFVISSFGAGLLVLLLTPLLKRLLAGHE